MSAYTVGYGCPALKLATKPAPSFSAWLNCHGLSAQQILQNTDCREVSNVWTAMSSISGSLDLAISALYLNLNPEQGCACKSVRCLRASSVVGCSLWPARSLRRSLWGTHLGCLPCSGRIIMGWERREGRAWDHVCSILVSGWWAMLLF